jgi:hypothetical protein
VLGGAVIIMFGLITGAGMKMPHAVPFNRRNMLIIGDSLAVAIGLPLQEGLDTDAATGLKALLNSGLIAGGLRLDRPLPRAAPARGRGLTPALRRPEDVRPDAGSTGRS